jgi:hypothetical protein
LFLKSPHSSAILLQKKTFIATVFCELHDLSSDTAVATPNRRKYIQVPACNQPVFFFSAIFLTKRRSNFCHKFLKENTFYLVM